MVLSDRTIRQYIEEGRIKIDPYDPDELQPASVDLHFDKRVLVFRNNTAGYLDLRKDSVDLTEEVEIVPDVPFMLHPGEFVLGSTLEHIEIPNDLVARLEGKSSLGRIGLLIHSTAGYVDPGWKGHLTLELTNVSRIPITLYYGMRIGQISFLALSTPVDRPIRFTRITEPVPGATKPDHKPGASGLRTAAPK